MFIHRDHMFLCIERATVPFGPVLDAGTAEGVGSPTPYLNIIINMKTRAFSTATNLNFMGGVKPPYENAQGGLYIFNAVNSSNVLRGGAHRPDGRPVRHDRSGRVLHEIFSGGSVAPWATATPAKGPYFYLETKRYDLEDPQTKKRFKQLQMVYKLQSTTGAYVTQGNVDPDCHLREQDRWAPPLHRCGDFKFSSKFTLASAIALTTGTLRLDGNGGGVGSQVVKAVIYSDNAGSA